MERSLWSNFYLVSEVFEIVLGKRCNVTSSCLKNTLTKQQKLDVQPVAHAFSKMNTVNTPPLKGTVNRFYWFYCQRFSIDKASVEIFNKLLLQQKSDHIVQYKTNVLIQYNLDYSFETIQLSPWDLYKTQLH